VRDGAARVVDWQGDPVGNLDHVPTRNTLYATRAVNDRSNLFDAAGILEEASLDKYTFLRDSWLQRRRSLVYDGNPPREQLDSDDAK
jgi:phospholipid-binding lipoprotein MlaA